MACQRTVTILIEVEREDFRAAVAFHKSPKFSMRTDADADAYPVPRGMALAISDTLGKLTGDPTPSHQGRTLR